MSREQFLFVGERLCLDFVNTEAVAEGRRIDRLSDFEALVAWSVAAGTIDGAQARELATASTDRRGADRAFTSALAFRANLREMAEQMASGRRSVAPRILDGINEVLRTRAGQLAVVRVPAGYETRFRGRFSEPSDLLVPVAESAAALLSSGDVGQVKKCQNPQCILYFCDTTKNHARRWCSMTACGNRAKVAAHYQRARQAKTGAH